MYTRDQQILSIGTALLYPERAAEIAREPEELYGADDALTYLYAHLRSAVARRRDTGEPVTPLALLDEAVEADGEQFRAEYARLIGDCIAAAGAAPRPE